MSSTTAPGPRDKAQIGLTPLGAQHLDAIMESGWFEDRQDAYRAAIGLALAHNLAAHETDLSGVVTAYNFAGGIDKDGRLRSLIGMLKPEDAERPAAFSERLAHGGLAYLAQKLGDGASTLAEILAPQPLSES